MMTLLGLIMWVGQIRGTVILFGGNKSAPKRLKITLGIMQCLFAIAMLGLAME